MGLLGRYLSGLCAAVLGLCGAGWLVLTPLAFGYRGPAALTDRATGTGLAVISLLTLAGWTLAWRRRLRADGVLARTSRWQARRQARELRRQARELRRREPAGIGAPAGGTPDPAQVLSELRALLLPLLADPAPLVSPAEAPLEASAQAETPVEIHHHDSIPWPRGGQDPSGLAAIESMLAGAELLTAGVGEEEAW
jgi:hypothetical protein